MGPIQTIFSLNLRESLLAYQTHFDKIQQEKNLLAQRVRAKFESQVALVAGESPQAMVQKDSLTLQMD